jgi:hypothetical protein
VGVTAHAIHCNKQQRAIACRNYGAILVVLAIAHEADVCKLELHAPPLKSAVPARLLDCRAAYNTGSRLAPGIQDKC